MISVFTAAQSKCVESIVKASPCTCGRLPISFEVVLCVGPLYVIGCCFPLDPASVCTHTLLHHMTHVRTQE